MKERGRLLPWYFIWVRVKRRNKTKVGNIEIMWIQKQKKENTCNICCSNVVRSIQNKADIFQLAQRVSYSTIQLFRLPLWSSDFITDTPSKLRTAEQFHHLGNSELTSEKGPHYKVLCTFDNTFDRDIWWLHVTRSVFTLYCSGEEM